MIQGLAAVDRMAPLVGEAAGLSPATRPGAAVETTFADALTAAAQRAVTTLEGAEAKSLEALQGEVNMREVVDTVMAAEQTLQSSIAIRDKIVTAYLEVSRMAI